MCFWNVRIDLKYKFIMKIYLRTITFSEITRSDELLRQERFFPLKSPTLHPLTATTGCESSVNSSAGLPHNVIDTFERIRMKWIKKNELSTLYHISTSLFDLSTRMMSLFVISFPAREVKLTSSPRCLQIPITSKPSDENWYFEATKKEEVCLTNYGVLLQFFNLSDINKIVRSSGNIRSIFCTENNLGVVPHGQLIVMRECIESSVRSFDLKILEDIHISNLLIKLNLAQFCNPFFIIAT